MSVYTPVEREQLEAFLSNYNQGTLISFEGISAGIENTNYFVTTTAGEFVLTLFETLGKDELPYYLNLMAYLAEHDVPSAHPIADRSQTYLRTLNGKPTALVRRLNGASVETPRDHHCHAVGHALGHMHDVGRSFSEQRENSRGPHWWREMKTKLMPHLSTEDAALLTDEISFQSHHRHSSLPRGVIHADLFHDNVLFIDHRLSGIIDFYYACNDVLLYDIAITVNDWCCDNDGAIDERLLCQLLQTYQQQRPFISAEAEAWPVMLRAAALRFWLSRLHDRCFPRPGEITHSKDPEVFRRILLQRIHQQVPLREQWERALKG